MLSDRRVALVMILEGEEEVAAGRCTRMPPELVKEGGVGQPAEGKLCPAINQVGIRGGHRLVKGVLAAIDGQLLVAEDVEKAPADLPVSIGHHSALLQRGRQWS